MSGMQLGQKKSKTEEMQFLSFCLGEEEFSVEILNVLEIRRLEALTKLPSSPTYVKGVINIRGTIVPILDLRERFGMSAKEYDKATVIIVLHVNDKNGNHKVMGAIVDSVSDVYSVAVNTIKDPPAVTNNIGKEYIKGLVGLESDKEDEAMKMAIILDVDSFMASHDVGNLDVLPTDSVTE